MSGEKKRKQKAPQFIPRVATEKKGESQEKRKHARSSGLEQEEGET